MNTFYGYDPKTFAYTGMIFSVNQPADSTPVKPVAVLNGVEYPLENATFNPNTNTWSGDNPSYQVQKQVALLTQMVLAQSRKIDALTKQLQKQEELEYGSITIRTC